MACVLAYFLPVRNHLDIGWPARLPIVGKRTVSGVACWLCTLRFVLAFEFVSQPMAVQAAVLLARMAGAPCVRAKQSAVERPLHGVLNDTRQYRERFLITKDDEFCMLCADHTSYINMHDNRITAFAVDGTAYPLPMNMNDLEQALNPDRFFRLNRQYIANINGIRKISFYFSSKLIVRL